MPSLLSRQWADRQAPRNARSGLFELVTDELATRPLAKVVVLGSDLASDLARELRRLHPELRLRVLDPAIGRATLHTELSVDNPYNLIIDLVEADAAGRQVRRFLDVFLHLGGGGAYVTQVVHAPSDDGTVDPVLAGLDLEGLLRAAQTTVLDEAAAETEQDVAWLGLIAGEVNRRGSALLVRNRRRVRPKLRDGELNLILRRRPEVGELVQTRAGGRFTSRCDYADSTTFTDDGSALELGRLGQFVVPPLHLRRYDQPTCGRGQIVESGGLFLTDTFRHHRRPRLQNIYLNDVGEFFAENKYTLSNPTDLPGAYFHFDSEWPGHYGHTMSEQISRLWAFQRARQLEPDLKLLTALPRIRPEPRLQPWELEAPRHPGPGRR
jgi:hypothetical protein